MKYLDLAMNAAEKFGAEYADIRIQKTTDQVIYLQNLSLKHTSNNVLQGWHSGFQRWCLGFCA